LKPGNDLFLPDYQKYKIKKGDTLFKIAECSLVSIEDLEQRNKNLNAKKLIIGNLIKTPYFAKLDNCKNNKKKYKRNSIKETKIKKIFKWPIKGKIIATYGVKKSGRRNDGINIKAPVGSPVRAARAGKVIYRGNELPAWGNLILVKHDNGWTTAYAHLENFFVNVGTKLKTGDIIASVGNSGNVDNYQLHFQVRKNSKPLDPLKFLYK
ncbi:peptidoglycan DD-metalloendopeptidase family protein, partial [Alphaproteobacteria bacterium]|nr:peptidoglycan DD-metalloendopeptidase family protein [Alphaproteobacteria bacterium]